MIALFPGQGSQSVGMGKWLVENFSEAKQIFEESSDALSQNMKKLCFDSSEADLALTANTQPALLTVSYATFQVLEKKLNFIPKVAAGHSIGEFAAFVGAKVLKFSDAVRAVRLRGQAMQAAVPAGTGGMCAVMGLDLEQTKKLCAWAESASGKNPVSPANINSPGQIVISGNKQALDYARENLAAAELFPGLRVKLIPLNVSAPFHCAMMKPAEEKLRDFFSTLSFSPARFPICQNLTAELEMDRETLRENLVRQVSAPVLWQQSMENLFALGHRKGIECGNGAVIKGLWKKINPEFEVLSMHSLEDFKVLEGLIQS